MGIVDRVHVEVHEATEQEKDELENLPTLSGDGEGELQPPAPDEVPEDGEPQTVEEDEE